MSKGPSSVSPRNRILFWGPVLILFGVFCSSALAQLASGPQRIEEIRIVGNRRIPESTIRYYIQSKENDPYNKDAILRDYRSLLNTSFFEDATVQVQQGDTGVIVIFNVKERPIIRGIEYEGMKSFKESDVLERFRDMKVGLTVDTPFDQAKLPMARKALKSLLDQNGRPLGRVDAEVEHLTSSTVKVVFKIDEGPKVRIGDISFEGNTIFKDDELRDALELDKERGLTTMFKGKDKYIKEKLEYDIQTNLLAKYREVGYIYAKAGEPKVEIVEGPRGLLLGFRKTKQQYYIKIPIEEGEQYHYGTFKIEGLQHLNTKYVEAVYNVKPGAVVNYKHLKEATDNLKKFYSKLGYLDVEAIPQITPDQQKKTIDIDIQVTEGRQYIVHRIEFSGNTKTRDKVLRREFVLGEQQTFNGDLLDLSILRLNQLGFFEKIEEKDYDVVKDPKNNQVDVKVKVKEKSQQSIGLTGGVSGISGSFFGLNYSTNNFRGLGQRINVSVLTGTRTTNFTFAFTDPYFMDTRVSLGWSVFNTRTRFDTFQAGLQLGVITSPDSSVELFTQKATGFTVSGSYPIFPPFTRLGVSYSLQTNTVDAGSDIFSQLALEQLRLFTPSGSLDEARQGIIRSQVTPSFIYNTKNSPFEATRGTRLAVEVPVAGGPLGGTYNLVKPFIEYQKFFRDRFMSGGRNVWAFRIQAQHIIPFGKLPAGGPMTVPLIERIWAGGEFDLRGFRLRSISPLAFLRSPQTDPNGNPVIDPKTGLPGVTASVQTIGGDTSLVGTAEYRVHVAGPLEVVGFADVGTVSVLRKSNLRFFGPNVSVNLVDSTNNVLRASTGAEIRFMMPVVNQPFRLIFAYNPLILNTNVVFRGRRFALKDKRTNIQFTVGYNF